MVRLIPGDNGFLLVAFIAWWAASGCCSARPSGSSSGTDGACLPWMLASAVGVALALWTLNGYLATNIQFSLFAVIRDGAVAGAIDGVITGSVMRFFPPPRQRSVAALSL
jgi:hypothetical protein